MKHSSNETRARAFDRATAIMHARNLEAENARLERELQDARIAGSHINCELQLARLEAQNKALREALESIVADESGEWIDVQMDDPVGQLHEWVRSLKAQARKALEATP